ncbi:DUF4214 domain-containing protein [Pseudochelatococcus lubricantis]|uniref:DUF4214 domain-containing protein n=1 Tax=Pseudochelatococcus lubricantis TaxID=1538102 RepID=UPI0035EC54EA
MAVTYDLGADAARDEIANSTLPNDVKQAIQGILDAIPQGESVTIAEYAPGEDIPPGTDLLFIKQGSGEEIVIPSGVSIVILDTSENTVVSVDGSLPVVVYGGSGSDSIVLRSAAAQGFAGEIGQSSSLVSGGEGDDSIVGGDLAAYLSGGSGNDTVIGGSGDDTIVGGNGQNLLRGGDGNVTFYLADGSDTVEAGSGIDLVSFADVANNPNAAVVEASRANYEIDWQGDKAVVFNLVSNQQSEVTGVEYLRWADSALVVASDDNEGSVARLYEALFDRTTEFEGFKFWLDMYRDGASIAEIAERIFDTEEASSLSTLSNEDFVDLLYHNTLQRDADQGGRDYWIGRLTDGDDRVNVVLDFVYAEESGNKTADVIHVITDDDDQIV